MTEAETPWTEWTGGPCPVPSGTLVDLRFRDGTELFELPALKCVGMPDASMGYWYHAKGTETAPEHDIIAFRRSATEPEAKSVDLWEKVRPVSHDEADKIAKRLIRGSFRRDGEQLPYEERPQFSIPTRLDHDDDCLILGYVTQRKHAEARLSALLADCRETLQRLVELTPYAANTVSADGHHSAVKAIAASALDRIGPPEIGIKSIVRHRVLDFVGEVVGFDEGWLSVKWGDGSKSTVRPSNLIVERAA